MLNNSHVHLGHTYVCIQVLHSHMQYSTVTLIIKYLLIDNTSNATDRDNHVEKWKQNGSLPRKLCTLPKAQTWNPLLIEQERVRECSLNWVTRLPSPCSHWYTDHNIMSLFVTPNRWILKRFNSLYFTLFTSLFFLVYPLMQIIYSGKFQRILSHIYFFNTCPMFHYIVRFLAKGDDLF